MNRFFNLAYLPQLSLVLAVLLWASSFIALKIGVRGYDPMVVIFGRMLIGSICFLLIGLSLRRPIQYHKGDYKLIGFMVLCEPCFYFLFEAKAIVYTTASQAGLITATLPVLVLIAASFLLKERTGLSVWGGAVITIAGVCWLTLESSPAEDAPFPALGNFFEFLAMVCATGYTIAMRQLASRYSPFFLTAVQAFGGCLFYIPTLFLPSTSMPTTFNLQATLAVVYLGAAITLGAYGLYNYGLKYVPASKAAMYVNLIPVFAVLLGWLILDETLSFRQLIAAALVLGGVYMTQIESKEK